MSCGSVPNYKPSRGHDGYLINIINHDTAELLTFTNTKAQSSLDADAYAILKSVEIANVNGYPHITIETSNPYIYNATTAPNSAAAKYLWVATKKDIDFVIVLIPESENCAVGVSDRKPLTS